MDSGFRRNEQGTGAPHFTNGGAVYSNKKAGSTDPAFT